MSVTEARDKDLENKMGRLLQAGVGMAGLIMLAGGSLYLARHGGESVSYSHFHAPDPDLTTPGGVWRGVRAGHAAALIQLGVLVMIATPVLRVAFAIAGFARARDWLYSGISSVVLALLAYALLAAR